MVQAARRSATGSAARVRSRVSEEWRFSSLLRIQTAPVVHSAYYKMSTGVKEADCRTSHSKFFLVPWLCIYYIGMHTLASTSPVGLHGL